MKRVDGKVALITGAAKGIGLADARLLASEGAQVIITDINEQAGQEAARQLRDQLDAHIEFQALDVREEQAWQTLITHIRQHYGRLDILVNNATALVMANIEDTSVEQWEFVQAVNSRGTFLGCKTALPLMRESSGGSIVNMSSYSAITGESFVAAYTASKGAIRSLTKSVALYCYNRGDNIRCNSVHPGAINSAPLMALKDGSFMPIPNTGAAPPVRLGTPEDVAQMVLYLASDESRYVNGAEFVIDNTLTINTPINRSL